MYKIETAKDGQFYFNLLAKNNKVILTSEMYKTLATNQNGIQSVMKNGVSTKVVDNVNSETLEIGQDMVDNKFFYDEMNSLKGVALKVVEKFLDETKDEKKDPGSVYRSSDFLNKEEKEASFRDVFSIVYIQERSIIKFISDSVIIRHNSIEVSSNVDATELRRLNKILTKFLNREQSK